MKMIRKLGLAAALLASTQVATASSFTNMGFESGMTPWQGSGTRESSSSSGYTAYEGNYYGKVDGNESLWQTVSLSAGTTYDFVWRFISTDTNPTSLFGLVSTPDTALFNFTTLAQSGTSSVDTGWRYFSWVPNTDYTGPIAFSMIALDSLLRPSQSNSSLLIDSTVPLPGAALLFGSALLGAGALRRKQAAAKKSEMALA